MREEENPYASPAHVEAESLSPKDRQIEKLETILREFRRQVTAIAAIHLLCAVPIGFCVAEFFAFQVRYGKLMVDELIASGLGFSAAIALTVLSVSTYLKHRIAFRISNVIFLTGMVIGGLTMFLLKPFAFVIGAVILVMFGMILAQSQRILRFADLLTEAGIPLRAISITPEMIEALKRRMEASEG